MFGILVIMYKMHKKQIEFCLRVKERFQHYFSDSLVLDVGSMDINGNNRSLFNGGEYIGLDIGAGKNVDVVCPVHLYKPERQFDVVISTNMLEHDKYWGKSLPAMVHLLRSKGLLLISAASTKRREHGTTEKSSGSSPFTNDFYKNVTRNDLNSGLKFRQNFSKYECSLSRNIKDVYFWGIKR